MGQAWDYSSHAAAVWEPENDPCPKGWRVPTREELENLLTAENQWVFVDSLGGWQFGKNKETIFLPAGGRLILRVKADNTSVDNAGIFGYYWSSTPHERFETGAYTILFYRPMKTYIGVPHEGRKQGETICCVRDKSRKK